MTTATTLLKRVTLFALVYCAIAVLGAFAFPYKSLTDFFVYWVSVMWVMAPFGGPVLAILALWTIASHGQPEIQTEQRGRSVLDTDTGPSVSTGGRIMVNGRDQAGNIFGVSND